MIVTVNGQDAHAATGGIADPDPSLPAVILIHGAGMDCSAWFLQTRYLAYRGFRLFAVDLPGHGTSEGATIATVEEMAQWLGQFMEAAGIESAHLVGHSMGTFIALEMAALQPEKVDSIVLMGTAPALPVHPQLISDAESNLPAAAALMTAWSHAKPAHVGLHPTPGLWMLGGAQALVERSRPGVLASDFRACASYENAGEAAAAVTAKSTVIVGSGDKMTPAKKGQELATCLSNCTLITLADTGHMMMVESPKQVKQTLLAVQA
jgi:pimeloyl-ACP methyl ester carboxylesterase